MFAQRQKAPAALSGMHTARTYARNNVKRWHMIDDFANPEFFPGKLKMMEKKRPVSYTHLDVYKRQTIFFLLNLLSYRNHL